MKLLGFERCAGDLCCQETDSFYVPMKRTGKYSFMVCVPVYVSVCRRLLQAFNMCEKSFLR